MYVHNIEQVMTFYPELTKEDVKITWSMRKHRTFILMGFKFCGECSILIKTPDPTCRMCAKRFRTRIKTRMVV